MFCFAVLQIFIYPLFEYLWWIQLPVAQHMFYVALLLIVGLNCHGYNESGLSWYAGRDIRWSSISALAKYSAVITFICTCGVSLLVIQPLYIAEQGVFDSLKFLVAMWLNHLFKLAVIEALRIRSNSEVSNASVTTAV